MRISDWSSDVFSSDLLVSSDRAEIYAVDLRHAILAQNVAHWPAEGGGHFHEAVESHIEPDLAAHAAAAPSFDLAFQGWQGDGLDLAHIGEAFIEQHHVFLGAGQSHCGLLFKEGRKAGRSGGLGQSAREIGKIAVGDPLRSEEHTSELQSLMRISYAVFCLK